ncbi:FKBP-type peptidyl-prolyl cis-trans isomerase [Vreelandella venusta]|uniref:Peptidyl-prolyl cis-trans isomerase n=1 Tax=Vreelandella venusta TaxID=44935 RepID=A0ABX2BEI4_9GAMM|nr:FKBP-type peptidyl-prolyl cis-trans isomerase [Halomonas venusta]MBR9924936.1 FKBP-type peptidyl-prolyl cis-trans isomerase [Gammaproteobacteria bacterium]AZM97730.1 FKBP-type peptidyl-prolyl cis-trans isomerase [Halomonas venusta]MDW0360000.1 FKBP-type peptidyl-prolyl cis-trans isomerase [Halomonas venusta]MDX1353828.1 FKBP-type peptidyl-prolyl cis-trans isomerase [Halomonas venusta]MDX1715125.1 FKBP-type peptidyl-prolyl cis-trans isomerase [Halomonas venusta]
MKVLFSSTALASLLLVAPFAAAAPETDEQRLAYSLGVTLGESMQVDIEDLDLDAFTDGMRDVFDGEELALSEEEMMEALVAFQQRSMAEREQEAAEIAQRNLEEGQAYLAENAEREEVEVTESGLQYEVLESGDGATPGAEDTVEVNYEGMLLDGTVFDSSFERGQPVSFQVNQVIEGWQEALQLMSVGDSWMLYIPAELAYGEGGQGPIGPNEMLTFRVELLGVE